MPWCGWPLSWIGRPRVGRMPWTCTGNVNWAPGRNLKSKVPFKAAATMCRMHGQGMYRVRVSRMWVHWQCMWMHWVRWTRVWVVKR